MTDTEHPSDASDNRFAFAAVSLCGNTPKGSAPQWHEVAAFRAGTLPEDRASEVLSHIANDPACFQQWLDIAEAEAWAEEEALTDIDLPAEEPLISGQPGGAGNVALPAADRNHEVTGTPSFASKVSDTLHSLFKQPLPVYGGAFAAVVLAVLLAPLLPTGSGPSLQQQLDRSMDTYIETGQGYLGAPPPPRNTRSMSGLFDELSNSDVERLHFRYGMYQFNQNLKQAPAAQAPMNPEWQTWLAELPDAAVDCNTTADATHCDSTATDYQQLGQWSLMNAAACNILSTPEQAALSEDYWPEQYELYEQFRALPSVTQSQIFSPLIPELQQPAPATMCAIVTALVATGQ